MGQANNPENSLAAENEEISPADPPQEQIREGGPSDEERGGTYERGATTHVCWKITMRQHSPSLQLQTTYLKQRTQLLVTQMNLAIALKQERRLVILLRSAPREHKKGPLHSREM